MAGQTFVEYLVILPVLLLLLLGAIQFGFIYQAKSTLNYAAYLAAREGALDAGKKSSMQNALASGLTPLFTHQATPAGVVAGRATAFFETKPIPGINVSPSKIVVLNPTADQFRDFAVNSLAGGSGKEIPNDTLSYRKTTLGAKSGVPIQDANILKIRVTYCYQLTVPIADRVIHALSVGINSFTDGHSLTEFYGRGSALEYFLKDPCRAVNTFGKGHRIEIQSEAIVRMQTPFLEANL